MNRDWFRRRHRLLRVVAFLAIVLTWTTAPQAALAGPSPTGLDISWPQCHGGVPALAASPSLVIVGVTGGRAFTQNPCFASEYRWATAQGAAPAFYMNLNYPGSSTAARGQTGPSGTCQIVDASCHAFNYGYNAGQDAFTYAHSVGASSFGWWLDVETVNSWSTNPSLNVQVIRGAIRYFQDNKLAVGIYSVASMWRDIAGNFSPGLPIWVAQTEASVPTMTYCSSAYGFGGGSAVLVQHWTGAYDLDYGCPSQFQPSAAPLLGGPNLAAAGSATAPLPIVSETSGSLAGSSGGTAVYYTFASSGTGAPQTVNISFWPHGADVANGLFVTLNQNGAVLDKVAASNSSTPGQVTLRFASRRSEPLVLQIVDYNSPQPGTTVNYDLRLG